MVVVDCEAVASALLGVDSAFGFAADSTDAPLVLQEGVILSQRDPVFVAELSVSLSSSRFAVRCGISQALTDARRLPAET